MRLQVRQFHFYKIIEKEKQYRARKIIGYSDEQMYKVVADIKHYKQFLPFCTKSTILSRKENIVHANLEVGFPPIVENYTSKVTLIDSRLVKAQCNDGRLFNYLETTWKFAPGLRSLATMFFERVVKQMECAFIHEAKRRYGPEAIPCCPMTKDHC